ncbi:protein phosphatase CheZ [Ideonella sp. B7]|uniref:protein phosphatase CheZ n=1 Tax=Ideonella benzenivorans TaxID=2831643 RepID=UPI001CED3657|nr:protein phosphatase CheZ [Ideonella benzenivorans]MCA6216863.1 protein phosphatase CheZ [Ideonella benzenivorans]
MPAEQHPTAPSCISPASVPEGGQRPRVAAELRQVSLEMPDACERLEYIGKMTERAANRVLEVIDEAKPLCERLVSRGDELVDVMRRQAESPEMDVARARALMRLCADYVASTTDFARQQNDHLTDILMAQDFQDLSGQVIKKVTDILLRAEAELRHVVEDELPQVGVDGASANDDGHQLEGVQVPDRAMQQEDVDDLLASLGF